MSHGRVSRRACRRHRRHRRVGVCGRCGLARGRRGLPRHQHGRRRTRRLPAPQRSRRACHDRASTSPTRRRCGGFYAALPPLWASVHLAGGFAMSPVAETSARRFRRSVPDERAVGVPVLGRGGPAIRARTEPGPGGAKGGRIVNVAARPALEPRLGSGMVAYTTSKAAVAAMTQALGAGNRGRGDLGQCGGAVDPRYPGQPRRDARGRSFGAGSRRPRSPN